jgi:hypothetical protein
MYTATYKNTDEMRMVYRAVKQKLIGMGSDLSASVKMNKQAKTLSCPDEAGSLLEQKSQLLARKYTLQGPVKQY